jgi:hypothetical protein
MCEHSVAHDKKYDPRDCTEYKEECFNNGGITEVICRECSGVKK